MQPAVPLAYFERRCWGCAHLIPEFLNRVSPAVTSRHALPNSRIGGRRPFIITASVSTCAFV